MDKQAQDQPVQGVFARSSEAGVPGHPLLGEAFNANEDVPRRHQGLRLYQAPAQADLLPDQRGRRYRAFSPRLRANARTRDQRVQRPALAAAQEGRRVIAR